MENKEMGTSCSDQRDEKKKRETVAKVTLLCITLLMATSFPLATRNVEENANTHTQIKAFLCTNHRCFFMR